MAGTTVIAALGWALLDFVWQGLAVGALAALAMLALRNARPQARYAVACTALALCLALPLAGLWRGLAISTPENAPDMPASSLMSMARSLEVEAAAAPAIDWRGTLQAQMPAIVAAWAAGALLLALRLLLGCHWVGRLRAGARLPNSWWQGRFDELAVHVGLSRPVPVRLSDAIDTPVAAGWWRPVVLVPAALLASLPVEYVEALLAHELAHVRRRDYLVNLLQGAVETLLFYHPVVWWLSRRVRIEREQIADDLASRALGDPRRLALALQALDAFQEERALRGASLPHAPQLLPAAHGGHLMSRIKRLLRPDHQRPDWKLALPVAGLAALGLAVHAAQAMAPAVPAVAPVARVAAVPNVAAVPAVAPVAKVAPATRAVPAVAPAVAPAAEVAPAPRVGAIAAVPAVASVTNSSIRTKAGRTPYAMVREGEDGMTLSGDLDDMHDINIARQHVHGDFLWFRRNGVGYVVQDAALMARARRAWAPAQEVSAKMEALSAQMKPHSERMEALGKQMEQYSSRGEPYSREMEALGKKMEPLARQQAELGLKMQKLAAKQMADQDSEAAMQAHEVDMQRLQVQMDGLSEKMEVLSRQMNVQSEQMRKVHEPMEALGKQMQEASAPMEALGKQMEPLGKQMEAISHQADAEVSQVIDAALRDGKAVPAKQLSR
jgi:beta-lactamase regulating signal transducer with metallopeptidase domain/predicted  nucleic acid-binding Zn-ribbon protein